MDEGRREHDEQIERDLAELVAEEKRRTEQWDELLDIMHAIADSLVPLVPGPGKLKRNVMLFGAISKK